MFASQKQMTPLKDSLDQLKKEVSDANTKALELMEKDKLTQALSTINSIMDNTKYKIKAVLLSDEWKKLDSTKWKVEELINTQALEKASEKIRNLILETINALSPFNYQDANSKLNSIDGELQRNQSIRDAFSRELGALHFEVARNLQADPRKMNTHLERSRNFGNQNAQVVLNGQNFNQIPLHDLRGDPFKPPF
jgi:hypothetical protein